MNRRNLLSALPMLFLLPFKKQETPYAVEKIHTASIQIGDKVKTRQFCNHTHFYSEKYRNQRILYVVSIDSAKMNYNKNYIDAVFDKHYPNWKNHNIVFLTYDKNLKRREFWCPEENVIKV